jgi:thiol:disulfide interchange protein DsbC
MVDAKPPAKSAAACDDSAIERNLALARRYRVNGTPAVIFEDGNRAPGALTAEQLEKRLLGAVKS